MAVETSIGYAGTVDETDWARYAGAMGARYTVAGPGDLVPSINTTQARTVRIAAGVAVGCGVIDTVSTTDVQLPVVASGSRWYLIVLKRIWGATKASTITYVDVPQTSATLPLRATSPGVEDDQPLALALVTAGQTQVQNVLDARVWSTNGGAAARHNIVLQYLDQPGTQVQIGDLLYIRRLASGSSAEWFSSDLTGARGPRPSILIGRSDDLTYGITADWLVGSQPAVTEEDYNPASVGMSAVMGSVQSAPPRITFNEGGLYSFGYRIAVSVEPNQPRINSQFGTFGGGRIDPGNQVGIDTLDYPGDGEVRYLQGADTRWLRAGTGLGLRLSHNAPLIRVNNWRLWATWLGN